MRKEKKPEEVFAFTVRVKGGTSSRLVENAYWLPERILSVSVHYYLLSHIE